MTVRENMSFALDLKKRPKAEIVAAVAEASAILGLDDDLDRRPKANHAPTFKLDHTSGAAHLRSL